MLPATDLDTLGSVLPDFEWSKQTGSAAIYNWLHQKESGGNHSSALRQTFTAGITSMDKKVLLVTLTA